MDQRLLRGTIIFAVVLCGITIVGSFFPTAFTWGFHSLAFLPLHYLVLYCLFVLGGLWYVATGKIEQPIIRLSGFMESRPKAFLGTVIGCFFAVAIFLRVNVPLLGDSFIAIKLYENTFHGAHPLPASHQPLALFYFYYWIKLLGTVSYPEIMSAFLAGELLAGTGFIVIAFFTVKNLFDTAQTRCLSFLFLLSLPYIQLFFGYVELYGLVLCVLSLYVLAIVLYFKQKTPFWVLPGIFMLLILVHYLNLLLAPSLLYVTYLEFRKNKFKHLLMSLGLVGIVCLLGTIIVEFHIEKFIPPPRSTPLLSLTPSDDIYQAYTLFSPYHFIDLANLAILLIPSAFFLFFMTFRYARQIFLSASINKFFIMGIVPIIIFFILAKFDLPMAQDWDVASSYAYLVALFVLIVTAGWRTSNISTILSLIIFVTLVNSFVYFSVNASIEPNINRARTFIDPRISSHDGCYQSTLHLTEYFIHTQDRNRITEVSEKFIDLFPTDKRGYSNYTLYLMQFGKPMDEKISGIFERWMKIDSGGTQAQKQYADFLLDIGNRSYHDGSLTEARILLEKSVTFNPALPETYNSLGIIYRKMGNNDSAIIFYKKTLELDPKSVFACINLGNAYDDTGNTDTAIVWYQRALALQPDNGSAYYNMGFSYAKKGMMQEATDALKNAARLGDAEAQQLLRRRGISW